MRHLLFAIPMLLLISCADKQSSSVETSSKAIQMVKSELQSLLDSAGVQGAILIWDETENTYYSNNFEKAHEVQVPASTFKIPNTIIGLELGLLKDEESIFTWNGEARALPIWEEDLTVQEAFQKSCVPCYQELARSIGTDRMKAYVEKLAFGKMDIHDDNIDLFWLVGNSEISPFQEIDFLKRLVHEELPISTHTTETVKKIMIMESNPDYILRGKTGLAVRSETETGWFVGYIEKSGDNFYFATKITPKLASMPREKLAEARIKLTKSALKIVRVL